MRRQVDLSNQKRSPALDPDALVSYSPKFNEYGLIIHDGGSSVVLVSFCPWCGTRLPDSLRERWFSELEALGFDDPAVQEIPEKFTSEEWYRAV
jgi:hypothetical protein